MNKLSKPISSPGRTEKFPPPPPLMRFLRINVGSKSRKRSRASPMFVRKKNTLIETTQEPSSPKVTCIGQVRVRRSKKNKKTTAATTSLHHHHTHRRNRLCRCLKNIRSKPFLTAWTQCVSFFQSWSCCCCYSCWSCYCNSNNNSGDLHTSPSPVVMEPVTTGKNNDVEKREQEEKVDGINEGLISRPTPDNALLLTRCRSAPYRSSSLASIFRESIMEKTSEEQEEEEKEEDVAEKVENLKIEKEDESNECEESKAAPLMLSRCKSAPARRWDQLLLV